jgi:hypothetical protein
MSDATEHPTEPEAVRTAYVPPPATLPIPATGPSAPVPSGSPPEYAGRPPATPPLFASVGPEPVWSEPVASEPVWSEPVGSDAVPVAVDEPATVPHLVSAAAPPPPPLPLPPPLVGPAGPAPRPVPALRRRRVLVAALLIPVALLVLGIGVGVGRISAANTKANQGSTGTDTGVPTPLPVPTPTTPPTPVVSSPPATAPPGRPTTPDQALTLTDQQALDELSLETTESGPALTGLAGAWIPQVSSKCVGISVDIAPSWVPDGVDDTPHVTVQQILAFQLSLHNRFGALTLLPTQVGVPSNQATAGPCQGRTVWMSVVPQQFGTADAANAWCSVNVPPVRECAARYVARPGEDSRLVLRQ